MSDTGELITRVYSNFRGVDFRGDEINIVRSPDSLNVWKDYKETESIRTRPELELKGFQGQKINGIYFFNDGIYVHVGTQFKGVIDENTTVEYNVTMNDAPSSGFIRDGYLYLIDGKEYRRFNGEGFSLVENGYVPTTSIARRPNGGGTIYEDINMLSDYRINTFLSDGNEKEYLLDTMNIDKGFIPVVEVMDAAKKDFVVKTVDTDYTVDYEKGKIIFKEVIPDESQLTDGKDNVKVKFKKRVDGYRENITNCTLIQTFDNRVFFSGNKDYPNVVWHCALNDPTYFSDLDYYQEGLDETPVRGIVAGNNALWVFREPSQTNTTVFYHTPTIDDEYGKIYPSSHSSVTTGCVGKAINFNDDIVFFSERGMEGISGDVTTEQAVAHRSTLVDRKMTAEPAYKDMVLAEWEGYLFVFIGENAYLADSRSVFTNENHIEYEWFYWELGKKVTCAAVYQGVLWLGTEDGVYTLTDFTSPVESYWVTPKDKFKYPNMQKTTNKKGCVAEATGDVTLYAKTENTEFEEIGTFNNVTDYFVGRIKKKKFKDMQLKFYSKTRFSLETVSLECFIGAYVKR